MLKIKRLPDAELEIMNALWDADAPLTAAELETALPGPPRARTTLLTLLARLEEKGCVALQYADSSGKLAHSNFPENPNGSMRDIAGICNPEGNVLGLMPHPENAVFEWQTLALASPAASGARRLFENGLRYAAF